MEDENEFDEVCIISDTGLQSKKVSPLQIARIEGRFGRLMQKEAHEDYVEIGLKESSETEGILTYLKIGDVQISPKLKGIQLEADELEAIAEFKAWARSEPGLATVDGELPTQMQRLACDKVCYIAATDQGILLTNGHQSRLLSGSIGPAVLWGNHFFACTREMLQIYDLNLECKFELELEVRYITTSDKTLVIKTGGSSSITILKQDFNVDSKTGKSSATKPGKTELKSHSVYPQKSKFWAGGNPFKNSDICGSRVVSISICPYTEEIVFVNWDRKKGANYIQRGAKITVLKNRYGLSSGLDFDPPSSSYSGKWYVVGYPQPEPQMKNIYLVDQKTLKLQETYYFDTNHGYETTFHFLKPHKQLFPVLMKAKWDFFLFCEFRDKLNVVCALKYSEEHPLPKHQFMTHLGGRVWLCLEDLTKQHLLVVDTDKLYRQLQVN